MTSRSSSGPTRRKLRACATRSANSRIRPAPNSNALRTGTGGQAAGNLIFMTGAGSTAVCYFAYPNADGTTYSVRIRVQVAYRHPLYVPIVATIVDTIDGTTDNALRLGASEEMRVETPPLTAAPTGLPTCP